jgi:DNA polymerase-3 subunit delta
VKVDAKTVEYLCDLVGESPGRIEQEFAKLASYVGSGKRITLQHVSEVGCGWQLRTTWDLVERVVEGDAAAAIEQLQRLIQGGEEPVAVLGAMSWMLRRLAAAARHAEWRMRRGDKRNLAESLRAAGFRNDYRESAPVAAERQLQQVGWQRCRSLLRRLVEVDLRLKGSHSSPTDARRLLEGLILELSKQARAAAVPSTSPRTW